MPRRKLSIQEQLRGVKAALRSLRTPTQLKPGLARRREALERQLGRERKPCLSPVADKSLCKSWATQWRVKTGKAGYSFPRQEE